MNDNQSCKILKLRKIDMNPNNNKLEIDIINDKSSFIIVVSHGTAKITHLPDHGETKIITHQGKVKRIKYDVGEEF